jgi:hypothetical protein
MGTARVFESPPSPQPSGLFVPQPGLSSHENKLAYKKWYHERHKNEEKEYARQRHLGNKEKDNARNKRWRLSNRIAVLSYYSQGKMACACCGERYFEFLSIDHQLNNGKEHRKAIGNPATGDRFYRWLINNTFPEGYQVLCLNCNIARSRYGACPHTCEKKECSVL